MKLVQLVGAATRRQELKHQGKYRTLNTTEKYFRNTEKLKKFNATNTRLRLHLLESNCYVQRKKWRDAAQRRVGSDRRWIRWMRRLATCSNFSDFGTPRFKLRAFGTRRCGARTARTDQQRSPTPDPRCGYHRQTTRD